MSVTAAKLDDVPLPWARERRQNRRGIKKRAPMLFLGHPAFANLAHQTTPLLEFGHAALVFGNHPFFDWIALCGRQKLYRITNTGKQQIDAPNFGFISPLRLGRVANLVPKH